MNMKILFSCLSVLLLSNLTLGLPPNYDDIEEAQDQPENAKGNSMIACTESKSINHKLRNIFILLFYTFSYISS